MVVSIDFDDSQDWTWAQAGGSFPVQANTYYECTIWAESWVNSQSNWSGPTSWSFLDLQGWVSSMTFTIP